MSADVAVVGAGVIGAGVALHLARSGARVTVIDDADPHAATPAGAGLVCPALVDDVPGPLADLLRLTGDLLPALVAELDRVAGDAGASVPGLLVAAEPQALESLAATVRARRDAGSPFAGEVEVIDRDEVRRLIPLLDRVEAAVRIPGAARISGPRFAAAQLAAAGPAVSVVRGRATAIVDDGDGCRVVAEGDEMRAARVVIAAGVRTELVTGLRDGWLDASRGQQLVVGAPDEVWPAGAPAVMTGARYAFADGAGTVRIGATHEHGERDAIATVGGVAELAGALVALSSRAADLPVRDALVGIRALSGDGLPTIGPLPGRERVHVATGLGPFGLMAGSGAARVAAALALDEDPGVDPAPFAPARWSA